MFSASGVSALEIGARYDFFCDDGQDIINAELADEDEKRYYVKLSVTVNKVPIEKKDVIRTVLKSPRPKPAAEPAAVAPVQKPIAVSLLPGLDLATGRLSDFASIAPAVTATGTYPWRDGFSFAARTDFLRFASGANALRVLAFSAGATYDLPWKFAGISFYAGAALGAAYIYAVTDVSSAHSLTPSAVVWGTAERPLYEKLTATAMLDVTYIFDRQTFVLMPGLKVGVSYRL